MPKIQYIKKRFSGHSKQIITKANEIVEEYIAQGFVLTLRQLYYQFVARGFIPNTQLSYKRLGSTINDARLAGLIDWEHITDRTRNLQANSHWNSPSDILVSAAKSYRVDLWATQKYRPEVWIEKDALIGVIEGICTDFDVPYFSCRGYTSQSEMWRAAMRCDNWRSEGFIPYIFHLGDHDPSGINMTQDITERLELLSGQYVEVERLGLNYNQVQQYEPPPNPAKQTDSRFQRYVDEFGSECWELDALEPAVMVDLIRQALLDILDDGKFDKQKRLQARGKKQLQKVSKKWPEIARMIR